MSESTTLQLALAALSGRVSIYQVVVDAIQLQIVVANAVVSDGGTPPVSVATLERELSYASELRDGAITARNNILSAMGG